MKQHRLALGVALAVLGMIALLWRLLPTDAAPEAAGRVEIANAVADPAAAPEQIAVAEPGPTKRLPITSTAPNAKVAIEQGYLVGNEKRDRAWAERSEAAIRELTGRIDYIGGDRHLEIRCAASVCEMTGIVDVDPETGTYDAVWRALERDTSGDDLRPYGLERTSAVFDTGRNPDEFRIYYRRVGPRS